MKKIDSEEITATPCSWNNSQRIRPKSNNCDTSGGLQLKKSIPQADKMIRCFYRLPPKFFFFFFFSQLPSVATKPVIQKKTETRNKHHQSWWPMASIETHFKWGKCQLKIKEKFFFFSGQNRDLHAVSDNVEIYLKASHWRLEINN